jgi:hypothetical protein
MGAHLLLHLLRALAALAENFPDNPRLVRGLLLGGGLLLCVVFVPDAAPEWGDLILILKYLECHCRRRVRGPGYVRIFSPLGVETAGKSPTDYHFAAAKITAHV